MFETKIIHPNIPAGHRIFVTSDLHGHGHYLRALLDKVNFSDDDYLVIVGDVLEKGPDSLGTLRYVMELCRRDNVYALMGNVDAFSIGLICQLTPEKAPQYFAHIQHWKSWWGTTLFHQMAEYLDLPLASAEDMLAAKPVIEDYFTPELAFIRSLPTILETDNYVFVHGGLRERLVADNAKCDMFDLTKYDDFVNATPHSFPKYVVVGHWPVILYRGNIPAHDPFIDHNKHIISIDGGCGIKEDGQLNLLCIPDIAADPQSITWERYDALQEVIALEAQEADFDCISITWHRRFLTILERGEEFTRIRHDATGKELDIPTAFLYRDTECRDYTNHRLAVKKGDRLRITHATTRGIIAKKDGTVGWYTGKYEV